MFFLEIENLWDPVRIPFCFCPYALIPAHRGREGSVLGSINIRRTPESPIVHVTAGACRYDESLRFFQVSVWPLPFLSLAAWLWARQSKMISICNNNIATL